MSDEFSARYRLLKCVAVEGGIRTHSAQELATGRVVLVHLADSAGPEDVEELRTQLGRLTGADRNRVLETATIPSGFAIVTEFVTGMSSLRAWLDSRLGVSGGTDESGAAAADGGVATTGGRAEAKTVSPSVETTGEASAPWLSAMPAPVVRPMTPLPLVPPPVASAPAGAFTQMFGAATPPPVTLPVAPPVTPSVAPSVAPPVAPPVTPPVAAAPPGAFTQMFASAALPPTTAPMARLDATPPSVTPPTAPAKSAPGEFTQMFSAPAKAAPLPESSRPSPMSAPATPLWMPTPTAPGSAPPSPMAMPPIATARPLTPSASSGHAPPIGGATGAMLGLSPSAGSVSPLFASTPSAPSPTPLPSALGMSPLFGSLPGAPPIGAAPPAPSPMGGSPLGGSPIPGILPPPVFKHVGSTPLSTLGGAVPAQAGVAGPSEFTQLISRAPMPVVPDAAVTAARPVKTNATEKRRLPMGLIIVINAVILIAVLMLVLVLKRPVSTVPTVPKAPSVSAPALKAPALPTPKP